MLAMVLLTFMVAGTMFWRRIAALKAGRIHPQAVALSSQVSSLLQDSRASDNFRNLFETPVLFYIAILIIYSARMGSAAYLILAWIYVASRFLHSWIQCGKNKVMSRFKVFVLSCVTLLIIWLLIAYDLLLAGRS